MVLRSRDCLTGILHRNRSQPWNHPKNKGNPLQDISPDAIPRFYRENRLRQRLNSIGHSIASLSIRGRCIEPYQTWLMTVQWCPAFHHPMPLATALASISKAADENHRNAPTIPCMGHNTIQCIKKNASLVGADCSCSSGKAQHSPRQRRPVQRFPPTLSSIWTRLQRQGQCMFAKCTTGAWIKKKEHGIFRGISCGTQSTRVGQNLVSEIESQTRIAAESPRLEVGSTFGWSMVCRCTRAS